jgi:hypothetical protein
MDGIPVHTGLILLLDLMFAERGLNVSILYQTLRAPQSNTKGCTRGLNRKAVADIRKDEAATAEDTFHIDGRGYGSKVSVHKTNARE